MTTRFEGISAYLYSVLWVSQIYRKLKKDFPDLQTKIVILLTDIPPATMIKIDKGNFEIEVLEDVKNSKDLEKIECDGYLALPIEAFYGGAKGIQEGIADKKVKIRNIEMLSILGKIMSIR